MSGKSVRWVLYINIFLLTALLVFGFRLRNQVIDGREKLIYVICTSVPPQTRNELTALRVSCIQVNEDLETSRRLRDARVNERLDEMEQNLRHEVE